MSAYQTLMLEFSTNKEDIKSDLLDEIKLFFPYFEDCDFKVRHFCDENATLSGTEIKNTVCIDENSIFFVFFFVFLSASVSCPFTARFLLLRA